jgi:hypothetical protein
MRLATSCGAAAAPISEAGQEFVFIPKGKGVLVMPVPELDQLARSG